MCVKLRVGLPVYLKRYFNKTKLQKVTQIQLTYLNCAFLLTGLLQWCCFCYIMFTLLGQAVVFCCTQISAILNSSIMCDIGVSLSHEGKCLQEMGTLNVPCPLIIKSLGQRAFLYFYETWIFCQCNQLCRKLYRKEILGSVQQIPQYCSIY